MLFVGIPLQLNFGLQEISLLPPPYHKPQDLRADPRWSVLISPPQSSCHGAKDHVSSLSVWV